MAVFQRGVAWLRGTRAAVVVLALGWVTVIAASAGRAADSDAWIGIPDTEFLTYFFVAGIVICAIITVLALVFLRSPGGKEARQKRSMWPMLVLMVIFLIISQRNQVEFEPPEEEIVEPDNPAPPPSAADSEPAGPGELNGGEFGILVVLLAAATAVVLWSRSNRAEVIPETSETDSLEAVLAPAVERAGLRLLDGDDPRSAVMLAYAELETTLSRIGQAAEKHETPTEHLRRVLANLNVETAPLFRLADLYQLARFSPRAITAEHQREAAESLQQVQRQLVASA